MDFRKLFTDFGELSLNVQNIAVTIEFVDVREEKVFALEKGGQADGSNPTAGSILKGFVLTPLQIRFCQCLL
jgi:hypothetical protein